MKYLIFITIISITLNSCQNNAHDHSTDAGQDEHKIQLTAYSDKFEIFAEADPFVNGQSSNILAHFSILPDFNALENAIITVRIIVNRKQTKQTLEKSIRKGIYSFNITPYNEGEGKLIFDIKSEQGTSQIIVNGITVYATEEEAEEAAAAEVVSHTNTFSFTKEQSWMIDFSTAMVITEPFGQIIKSTARVEPSQSDEIILSSRSPGILDFGGRNILEGTRVKKDQVLFTISGSSLADNNSSVRFIEAENNYKKAKADFDRIKELAKDKIVSEKKLLDSKTEYQNAKAIFDNLKNNFTTTGQVVKSPSNGYVQQLLAKNGQFLETGDPVAVIANNRRLILHSEIHQKFAKYLDSIQSVNIRTPHDNRIISMDELNGEVLSVGSNANSHNYLIPLNIQIENNGDFIPGGFVELYIKTISSSTALTVPNSAMLEEQGVFFVFVQITPELFEKREFVPGATDGLKTEIIQGLSKTDRIVTRGTMMIKLSQESGALDPHAGHVH